MTVADRSANRGRPPWYAQPSPTGNDNGGCDGDERSGPYPSQPAGRGPAEAQRGEQSAGEELGGTGRGGEIGHIGTPPAGDERRGRRGDHEEGGQHTDDHTSGALCPRCEHQDGGRPQQVELLLHRQRPEVVDRRGGIGGLPLEQVAVAAPLEQLLPVSDLQRRPPQLGTEVARPERCPQDLDGCNCKQAAQGCGRQPPEPAPVEGPQVDDAAAIVLHQEERRDEEARKGEEDGNPQVTAGGPRMPPWKARTASTATPRSPSSAGR